MSRVRASRKRLESQLGVVESTYGLDFGNIPNIDYTNKSCKSVNKTHEEQGVDSKTIDQNPKEEYERLFTETHVKFVGEPLPTTLYYDPSTNIVRTNHNKPLQLYSVKRQPTRHPSPESPPILPPAVDFSTVDNEETWKLLMADTYATTKGMADEHVQNAPTFRVETPFPRKYAPALPITLEPLKSPVVSPEWRMETVTWDARQMRGHCDASRHFWRHGRKRWNYAPTPL